MEDKHGQGRIRELKQKPPRKKTWRFHSIKKPTPLWNGHKYKNIIYYINSALSISAVKVREAKAKERRVLAVRRALQGFPCQKNTEQRCSAGNEIKKLCVEQKKGDNKTDANI